MTLSLLLLSALAPVVWLLWTIYRKDSAQPEPVGWLLRGFALGMVSVCISLAMSIPMERLMEMEADAEAYPSFMVAAADAFFTAAIPEEMAKFLMLWLLLRRNPFFDERFDGIVYAVCIGLGFAAVENVLYLVGGIEDWSWVSIGIVRALFSVPGHYFFAVLMGYYYSIYHFGIDRSAKARIMILAAPILAHGLYDTILFCMQMDDALSGVLVVAFIFFFSKLKNKANERIKELVNN